MSKEFYNTLHSSYYPIEGAHETSVGRSRRARCQAIIRKCKPHRVLEVGFESPDLSKSIAGLPGVEYVGVDISEAAVNSAREAGLQAFRVNVSEEKLPFDDHEFDLVYCAEVIEHLFNPDYALEEFVRVLKPNGNILLTTPNLASWYNRLLLLMGIQPVHTEISTLRILGRRFRLLGQGNRPVGHLRLFTVAGLVDLFGLHGLRVVAIEGYALELLSGLWLLEVVMSRFVSLASGFIVLCKS